jgi:predicted nucleic acid-binding protein
MMTNFLLAVASGRRIIFSGDKHLLTVSGYQGIEILKPHEFIKRYLQKRRSTTSVGRR